MTDDLMPGDLRERLAPLLPPGARRRPLHPGRRPVDARAALRRVVYVLGRRPVPPISPTWLPKLCDLIGAPQNGSEGSAETLLLTLQSTRPGATLRLARCGEALRRLRTLFGNLPGVIWIRF